MIFNTGKKIQVDEKIVICDFCKREMKNKNEQGDTILEDAGSVYASFGYYSNKRDGDKFNFDMCCDCATEVEKILRDKWPNLPKTENTLWD